MRSETFIADLGIEVEMIVRQRDDGTWRAAGDLARPCPRHGRPAELTPDHAARQRGGDRGHVRRGLQDARGARDRDRRDRRTGRARRPRSATGYATSVIGCDAEAGLEAEVPAGETPDGRPGVSLLVFGFNTAALGKALVNRIGQCVMTCPTTACFNGLHPGEESVKVGGMLRFFGDGYQASKKLDGPTLLARAGDGRRVPVRGRVRRAARGRGRQLPDPRRPTRPPPSAPRRLPSHAIRAIPGVILPFPGGVVRSGSKVGSRYKALRASTNEEYCPTLRGHGRSRLPRGGPRRLRDRHRRPGRRGGGGRDARRGPGRVRPRGRADQRRQLRREARPVPAAPPQDPRLVTAGAMPPRPA